MTTQTLKEKKFNITELTWYHYGFCCSFEAPRSFESGATQFLCVAGSIFCAESAPRSCFGQQHSVMSSPKTMRVFTILFLLIKGIAGQPNPEFDELNAALDGVIFGEDPGPCPNYGDCPGDAENIPDYIGAIQIELIPFLPRQRIDEVVIDGDLMVWNLQCGDLSLDDLEITQNPLQVRPPNEVIGVDINLDDLRLDCVGDVEFRDLDLQIYFIPLTLTGTAKIRLTKSSMTSEGGGVGAVLQTEFISPNFEQSAPQSFVFLEEEAGCLLRISDGLTLESIQLGNVNLGPVARGGINFLLFNLFKGLIEGIACQIIRQLAVLEEPPGAPGIINQLINDFNGNISEFESQGLRGRSNYEVDEANNIVALGSEIEPEKALNFAESNLFEAASVALNGFLGNTSTSPGYEGELVVNEIVDLLTEGSPGIVDVPDVLSAFGLKEYPSFFFEGALSNIDISLRGFTFEGLNSFERFQILDNGFAEPGNFGTPYDYTFLNDIFLRELTFKFDFGLTLSPGLWVNPSGEVRTIQFDFEAGLTLSDLDVQAATWLLFQIDQLIQLQVGQLIGDNQDLSAALNCSLIAVDHFRFSGLTASTSNLGDLQLINFFNLGELVGDGLTLINTLLKPTLNNSFPLIMENYIRPSINEVFDDSLFVGPPPLCAPYVALEYANPNDAYINFTANLGLAAVDSIVTKVVGGDPVSVNSADINNLIQGTLEYFATRVPENSTFTFSSPEDGTWEVDQDIFLDVVSSSGGGTVFNITGPRLRNLNSIHRLIISPSTASDYAIDFAISFGNGTLNTPVPPGTEYRGPLLLELPVAIRSDIGGVSFAAEDFVAQVLLDLEIDGTAEALLNTTDLYLSKIESLFDLRCALAVLDAQRLDPFDIILGSFQFEFVQRPGGPLEFLNASTQLGSALLTWNTELQTTSKATSRHFTNFLISRFVNETKALSTQPFDYVIGTCLEAEDPLNGTAFSAGLPTFDIDAFNDFLNKGAMEQPNPRGSEPTVWEASVASPGQPIFDITGVENAFIGVLSSLVTPESGRNILQFLGNQTVNEEFPSLLDPVIKILTLEDDDSVSLRVDLNEFYDINFEPDTESLLPGLKLTVDDIVVTNVDKFTALEVLKPYESLTGRAARFTTAQSIGYPTGQPLTVSFGLEFEVEKQVLDPLALPGEIIRDRIEVELDIRGVQIEVLFALAVNEMRLAATQIGELFYFDAPSQTFGIRQDALNCSLKELIYDNGMLLPQFQVFVDDVIGPNVQIDGGILSTGAIQSLNVFIEILVETYRESIPNLTQGPIREIIEDIFSILVADSRDARTCNGIELPDFSQVERFVNLTESQFPKDVASLIETDLLNEFSALYVNSIIDRYLSSAEFQLFNVFNDSQLIFNGIDLGTSSVQIGGAEIQGLGDSPGDAFISKLKFLDNTPFGESQPFTTRNEVAISGDFEVSFQLSYIFDGLFEELPEDDGTSLRRRLQRVVRNDLLLGIQVKDVELLLDIVTKVDVQAVLELYAGNLLDLYYTPAEVPCLIAIFDSNAGLAPQDFVFSTSELSLSLSCTDVCNSPFFAPLQSGGSEVTDPEVNQQLTDAINTFLSIITALVGSQDSQQYIDAAVDTAKQECTGVDFDFVIPPLEEVDNVARTLGFVGLGTFLAFMLTFILLVPVHNRRKEEVLAATVARLGAATSSDGDDDRSRKLLENELKSVFYHPSTPPKIRFFVPGVIGLATILFIGANLFTVGVSVNLVISIAGETTKPLPLLTFTLASSINDMFSAGTWPLGLMIFLASALWPHSKSILLLFSWFAPPTVLSKKRRGSLLGVLDALGKWSLIDAYVLIMLQVAFRFYLSSSFVEQLQFLPPDIVVVDVAVIPGLSIYLFCIATMVSLLINHLMIWVHMKICEDDLDLEDQLSGTYVAPGQKEGSRRQSVKNYVFAVPDDKHRLYGFGPGTQTIIMGLTGLSVAFVIVGASVLLLKFDFRGLAGFAISIIDSDLASSEYTLFTIATSISEGIPEEDIFAQIGVVFLQIIFMGFSFLTPLALPILWAVLWWRPLTLQSQKKMLFAAYILEAWNALVVLLISAFGATVEVSQLAQFIVVNVSGSLCSLVVDPLLYLGVPQDEALCFDVDARFAPTAIILILGCVLTILHSMIMFRLVGSAVRDRDHAARGRTGRFGYCPGDRSAQPSFLRRQILSRSVVPMRRIRSMVLSEEQESQVVASQNPFFNQLKAPRVQPKSMRNNPASPPVQRQQNRNLRRISIESDDSIRV